MEEENLKKIVKSTVCAVFLSAIILLSSAVSAEDIKPATNKVPAMQSFFSRFLKPKAEKKAQPVANSTPTIIASLNMTIEDCVNYGLKHNPNIKVSEDNQKIQKGAVGVAKSSYFPTIFGGTGYNINDTNYSGNKGNVQTTGNYYGLNMGVNQLIWDFGRTTANINMNKFNYLASGYNLDNIVLNSIYSVKIAYTAVLAARANEDIYARSVRINELNVERTRAMYEVGLKSKIDVVNAEVYLTEAQISLIEAQNTYQTSLIKLNNSMYYVDAPDYSIAPTETFNFQKNYSVKNEINVAYDRKNFDEHSVDSEIKDGAILTSGIEKRDILKTYNFTPFTMSMADAIQQAYANRPDLKALELVQKASEESIKAIKRSFMPAINGSANYNYQAHSDYNSNGVGIYAGANLPNVNAMSVKYQLDQGKAYLDIAVSNVDLLRKNIYFQVQNYYVNMKQLERTIPLMSKRVEQTLENFELADGRYAVGLGNYLELQQAQTNYNNAQLAFVQSVFEYNQARYYLEQAMAVR